MSLKKWQNESEGPALCVFHGALLCLSTNLRLIDLSDTYQCVQTIMQTIKFNHQFLQSSEWEQKTHLFQIQDIPRYLDIRQPNSLLNHLTFGESDFIKFRPIVLKVFMLYVYVLYLSKTVLATYPLVLA